MTQNVRPHIQINGGGLAGWAAAAVLANELSGVIDVQIDASGADTTGDYGNVVLDSESILLRHSGKTAAELIVAAAGGFSLGGCFENWGPEGQPIYHAPGEALPANDGVALHQILRRLSALEKQDALFAELYLPLAFQARVAAAGKFAPPADDRQSPRSLLRPGIALNALLYAGILRTEALASGVQERAGDDDDALLVIDCRADDAPKDVDCSTALGFDRSLSVLVGRGDTGHPPHSSIRQLDITLLNIAPLQNADLASLLYPTANIDADAARELMTSQIGGIDAGDMEEQTIAAGRMKAPWQGNRLKLGTGAMQLGPMLAADSKLLSMQLEALVRLIPGSTGNDMPSKTAEYNVQVAARFDHLRDFLQLPLLRNNLPGAHWANLRMQAASPNLQRRLEQFERRGILVLVDKDIFEKHVWLEMLVGLGITPQIYDRVADGIDLPAKMKQLGQMVMAFDQTIEAMPSHKDFMTDMIGRM